jgi:magnesium transporter
MDIKAIDLYLQKLKSGSKEEKKTHVDDADLADYLEEVKNKDENKFFDYLNSLPTELRAQTFIELPTAFQVDLILKYDPQGLAEILETLESDDATDLFIAIGKTDKDKEEEVFLLLKDRTQKNIEKLILYNHNEAGSLMQTEIFKVGVDKSVDYAISKLARLKENGIGSVQSVFITDEKGRFLKAIPIDDLILEKKESKFEEILPKYTDEYCIASHDSMDEVVNIIEKYDLVSLAVIDRIGHLLGRITHDDVLDIMQERATKQLYNMNQLDENEEIQESVLKTTRNRGKWLLLNLLNVTLASIVIGFFEDTLNAVVALAILMPIVANMAGTSASQTMTVIVRQIGLGEIQTHDFFSILKKESIISSVNGIGLGIVTMVISQIRYEDTMVSVAIGLAMVFSFVFASIIGTSIPILLKKLNIDPAVVSSVFVLTIVDMIGFFSFLWFAQLIVLK